MAKKLPKIVVRGKKRRGRGYGSGRGGHTVGRGTKGQKARGKVGILFEGLKMKKSLIKRLPMQRGKGRFKAREKPLVVKLAYLNLLPAGSKVDTALLVKYGIVKESDARKLGVKILGNGEVKKRLTISLPISKSAANKVEKAGGKIVSGRRQKSKAEAAKDQKPSVKTKTKAPVRKKKNSGKSKA